MAKAVAAATWCSLLGGFCFVNTPLREPTVPASGGGSQSSESPWACGGRAAGTSWPDLPNCCLLLHLSPCLSLHFLQGGRDPCPQLWQLPSIPKSLNDWFPPALGEEPTLTAAALEAWTPVASNGQIGPRARPVWTCCCFPFLLNPPTVTEVASPRGQLYAPPDSLSLPGRADLPVGWSTPNPGLGQLNVWSSHH